MESRHLGRVGRSCSGCTHAGLRRGWATTFSVTVYSRIAEKRRAYLGCHIMQGFQRSKRQLLKLSDRLDESCTVSVILHGHVAEAQLGVGVNDPALVELFGFCQDFFRQRSERHFLVQCYKRSRSVYQDAHRHFYGYRRVGGG